MKSYIPLPISAPWAKTHRELGLSALDWDELWLHEVVAKHASERPDSIAIQFFSAVISYRELHELSQRFAAGLVSMGIGEGDVVGVHLPNTPQYVITLTALSHIGAMGTGLSQLQSPSELAFQIADSSTSALLTLDVNLPAIKQAGDMPECLKSIIVTGVTDHLNTAPHPEGDGADGYIPYLSLLSEDLPAVEPVKRSVDDTFMIQYTGGTTGRPKGAQLSARALMTNPLLSAIPPFDVGNEVVVSTFPMFHVAGLSALLWFIQSGGCGAIVPDPRDIPQVCRYINALKPTRIAAVPALYQMLLLDPDFRNADYSGLRVAASGAAPMPPSVLEDLISVVGEGKFSDVFGMTETGPCYTIHPPSHYKKGSVGLPTPGALVRIVDVETGTKTLPLGEPGEICAAGPQLMNGYLNLPDETHQALREYDGHIWMHSGDVGYMDEDGYIFLCDRAKDMLNVGGFKVFSVEVESKLNRLSFIDNCAIIGKKDKDRPGNDIVTLFVQASSDGGAPDEMRSAILDYCKVEMAPYKCPKEIQFIDAIPLTPVGKIDKKKLRADLHLD